MNGAPANLHPKTESTETAKALDGLAIEPGSLAPDSVNIDITLVLGKQ